MGGPLFSDDPRNNRTLTPASGPVRSTDPVQYPPLPPEYDPSKSVKKGLSSAIIAFLAQLLGIAMVAIAGTLVDAETIKSVLAEAHIPKLVALVLVPIIVGIGHGLLNRQKNKDN